MSLELVNSGTGLPYTAYMDDGSATQAATVVSLGGVMSSRQETQPRAALRGLLVHWFVRSPVSGNVTVSAAAVFDNVGSPFCQAEVVAMRA